ncbi:MAG: methyltransferase [Bacteroidia bacterium]|nr:methyltransferase [Bacteroidia bacterium]
MSSGHAPFRFRQFTVHHDRCAMKVGTDGVLLGAWADLPIAGAGLDIGTGSGLLALMAAQRSPGLVLDAVEPDPAAAAQARDNIQASPWRDRIEIWETRIQAFTPPRAYEVILCNPPFFRQALAAPDPVRHLARHADDLPYEALIETLVRLLMPQGTASMIIPVSEGPHLLRLTAAAGLKMIRQTVVRTTPAKAPYRWLLTLSREDIPLATDELVLHEPGSNRYSAAHQALTGAFYL